MILGEVRNLYIDLIKKCLIGFIYQDDSLYNWNLPNIKGFDLQSREQGYDWPSQAHSMIGIKRMDNIQYCAEKIFSESISGDFIETGVWRGGASIFMRALLKSYNIKDKNVWVADSFEGLPAPNEKKYPQDKGRYLNTYSELTVSLESVKSNFLKYGLLDDQVKFLKGWFKDTLPVAPIDKISLLRLDGDLYESTMDSLKYLYPKLSIGGYIIIDDYGALKPCREAVNDYRNSHNITEEVLPIDWAGVYWKRIK